MAGFPRLEVEVAIEDSGGTCAVGLSIAAVE